jgi:hypothetical protein
MMIIKALKIPGIKFEPKAKAQYRGGESPVKSTAG